LISIALSFEKGCFAGKRNVGYKCKPLPHSELAAACISDVKIFIREGSAVPAVGIEERSRDFSFSVLFAPRTLLPKTG